MTNSKENEQISLLVETNVSQALPAKILRFGLLIGEIILLILQACYIIAESVYRVLYPIGKKSVKQEIVLVTGAGRGIGRELALQYASLGATVVCWGISKDKNLATVDEIARLGYPKAYFYECDVRNQRSVIEAAKRVQQEVGDVTILVNNAGIAIPKPLFEQSYSEIEDTININLLSHFWTIQAFLPSMIKRNHGHIVANSSIGGIMGLKNGTSYSASKFAIRGMMEALYQELRLNPNCRIKLTTVYPYLVNTGIFKRALIRFPKLMPILDAQNVAKQIIAAQRRDVFEVTLPKYMSYLNSICRLFPISVCTLVYDFFNINIEE